MLMMLDLKKMGEMLTAQLRISTQQSQERHNTKKR